MIRATWRDTLLAASDQPVFVDGIAHFPPESVDWSRLRRREDTSRDAASSPGRERQSIHYDVVVDWVQLAAGATAVMGADAEQGTRGYVSFAPQVRVSRRPGSARRERGQLSQEVGWLWCGHTVS